MDNVETIYSLSPLQKGLLFHSIYEPQSRVYQQQLSLRIEGALDGHAFAAAWRHMVARYPVLRSAILWDDLDDSYQVVLNDLPLPLIELDWRGRDAQDAALRELEIAQRQEPLDLTAPPLMRLCLVRLGPRRWQFIWTHHHIVLDGWSEGIVLRDWLACYRALCRGQAPALPPTRPFQDYIAWLAEQDATAAEAYWRERLESVTEPTPLPSFASVPLLEGGLPHPELSYAEQSLVLSTVESRRLLEFARAQRVTLNTLVQAAWGWLLGTYAGHRQALFGVTLSGRADSLAHADDMVGLFINTLPLCVEWQQDQAIGDWLRELQAQAAELRQYEYSPLSRLKGLSGIPGDRALFEAILVFENFPLDASLSEAALGDESAELRFSASEGATQMGDVRLSQGRNNFPLSLIAIPSGEAFEFALSYARQRFSDEQIRHMLRHFRAVLDELTRDGQASVETLQGLAAEERQQLLAWGTGAALPVPAVALHQLFEQQVDTHPQQDALATRTATLSYRELDARANQLARHLGGLGVQPGQFVAIALERGADFIVALLAVLKAGAAYLPLDLKQPSARLAELLADSGAPLAITHSAIRQQLASCAATLVELDSLGEALAAASPARLGIELPSDAAAYLIYTSGSTGAPKGVVVEHRAVVDYVHGVGAALDLPVPGRYAMLSSVAADLGHTQLFGALCRGGTLVLVDEETSFSPLALADFLTAQRVDVLKITPSHMRGLLDAHGSAALLPRHTLVFGGDALDGALVDQVRALAPRLRICNHYGPTEATVGAVATVLGAPVGATISLGKPLPNRSLHVLDPQGRPTPIGVPGELYIGGALARGYLHRPELTQERFLTDVVVGDGTRLYRTGDRVCWLASGELAFLGRVDNQVKIRGNRVELGEVEAQIRQLSPDIRQVVARLVQTPGQAPRLAAYIVGGQSVSAAKLRDDLSLRVPDYMVPAHFIPLDAIPLTANGKPDYQQLPLPQDPAGIDSAYVAPRNELERRLAEIWQDVLKVERVGIHDNFFALGGDSILNLQIIARTNQQGLRLTPRQLFDNRTIADIAAALAGSAAPADTLPGDDSQPIPLSAGQRARLDAGPLSATWRCIGIDPDIDNALLTQALAAIQQHHPALRLALEMTPRGDWQQRLPRQAKAIGASDRSVPPADTDALAALAESCLQQLDLAAGETLHACLLREGATSAVLLVAHPLCVDEPSWPLVLGDLGLALAQLKHQRPVRLAPTGGDFPAWCRHQQDHAGSEALDASWEHWLQYAGLELPLLDVPEASSAATLRLEPAVSARLQRLRDSMQLSWTGVLASVLAEQIRASRSGADSAIVLDVYGGRPEAARLPADAPIAAADLDPSSIVGPLAVATPMFLHWPAVDDPLQRLRDFDGQLQGQPQQGADYGILRYLSANTYLQEPLATLPRSPIALRLLGDWDAHQEPHGPLQAVTAAGLSPAADHALTVDAYWHEGRLCLHCQGPLAASWGPALTARLESLADLAEAQRPQPVSHAFPLCRAQAASLIEQPLDWGEVEDVYPLTPMQQGMLLHTLLQPHRGIYLVQDRYRWDGPLDRAALESAWDALLARHPVLRTGFLWQDDHAPLQWVQRHSPPAFACYDWRHLDPETQQRQLAEVLAAERQRGFDLSRPPLTYLRVFQLGEDRYTVVRSVHHILSDAWCFNLLIQDLLALYVAHSQGQPAALPPPRAFRDYIRWLQRQDLEAAEAFWRDSLRGFATPTPLPFDRAPVSLEAAPRTVADVSLSLTAAQTEALRAFCRRQDLTLNTVLQGAWALLLGHYSGQQDVAFGITVAGRPPELPGAETIVGMLINTLPLRVRFEPEQSLAAWLREVQAHNLELRCFEYTPLADIQRWSEVGAGRTLFDSLLVYENAPQETALPVTELGVRVDVEGDTVHTNYPLMLVCYPDDRLRLRLAYDAERFEAATTERLLSHLARLLEEIPTQPEATMGSFEPITPAEREQLLVEWNQTAEDFPLDQTYAQLFAERVARHPERVAAVCLDESLTYAELDRRANRLAHALRSAGAGPETLVALLGERGLPLLTMMIAVFKAGAAYLPLDIHHPPARLGELLTLSGAPVLLTTEGAATVREGILAGLGRRPTCLTAEAVWLQGEPAPVSHQGGPDNLAYVIFTSGSTGTPKGAMVEQRGMLNNMFGKVPALGFNEHDRLAQTAPIAFDISVWQFLAAPLLGATVDILPDAIAHDPGLLLAAVEERGVTLLEVVPSMLRAMLEACPPDLSLADLRWLMSIGEALPPVLCRQWFERFPRVPLMNLYGPAECADNIGHHPITEAPANDCQHMPIGRPTANNQLFVLDERLRPLPIGVPGEICTAGVGVGRGYLNDPEKTQEAFVPHPFEPGARFYRTGDIGRYRPDGVIEYLGRKDHQVKIRGQRVELGEIENRLARHPAVGSAAVLARSDVRGEPRLVAYWQAKAPAEADALREHLAADLPAYMVPSTFVRLDALPLNANGKLDRKALAARPVELADDATEPHAAPRNALEAELAGVWADVLRLEQVGVEDNFFALGGHSLLATQVIGRLRRRYQVELPLKSLFDHPSIASLAPVVAAARAQSPVLLPALVSRPREERLPLSFAQQRLWFLEQLHPGSTHFNLPFALRLRGPVDAEALERSFVHLIARHEVLRTGFGSEDGTPHQRVHAHVPFQLGRTDLRVCPEPGRAHRLQAALDGLNSRPFDLSRPPLLRAQLLQCAAEEHVLAICLHHVVVDAWSIALLVRDLSALYAAWVRGDEPDLPPLTLQYADFALWQRQHLPGAVWQQQLAYWRQQLAGAEPVLLLPQAQPQIRRQGVAGRHLQALPRELEAALQALADAHGGTLFMVLHAALAVLLHHETGRTDLLIGADIANRHRPETEDMVGFFVNQLVLRCRLGREQAFSELLAACRDTALAGFQHQDLPFDALVAELLPSRDDRYSPFFQTKLVLQNGQDADLVLPGLEIEELPLNPPAPEVELLVNVQPTADGLMIVYDYNADLYAAPTIQRFVDRYQTLLQAVAAAPERTVAALCVLLDEARQPADHDHHQRDRQRAALHQARRKAVVQ